MDENCRDRAKIGGIGREEKEKNTKENSLNATVEF